LPFMSGYILPILWDHTRHPYAHLQRLIRCLSSDDAINHHILEFRNQYTIAVHHVRGRGGGALWSQRIEPTACRTSTQGKQTLVSQFALRAECMQDLRSSSGPLSAPPALVDRSDPQGRIFISCTRRGLKWNVGRGPRTLQTSCRSRSSRASAHVIRIDSGRNLL
jgi:hypothetical protein